MFYLLYIINIGVYKKCILTVILIILLLYSYTDTQNEKRYAGTDGKSIARHSHINKNTTNATIEFVRCLITCVTCIMANCSCIKNCAVS